jgi:hypothetical protein
MAITSKEINLAQLTEELGGKGLIANFNNLEEKIILPADGVNLTEEELNAAIEAHIAVSEEDKAAAEEATKQQAFNDAVAAAVAAVLAAQQAPQE